MWISSLIHITKSQCVLLVQNNWNYLYTKWMQGIVGASVSALSLRLSLASLLMVHLQLSFLLVYSFSTVFSVVLQWAKHYLYNNLCCICYIDCNNQLCKKETYGMMDIRIYRTSAHGERLSTTQWVLLWCELSLAMQRTLWSSCSNYTLKNATAWKSGKQKTILLSGW